MSDLIELRDILRDFTEVRDWGQFHTPQNLAKSVCIEAGELLECFQWSDSCDVHAAADEICDVMTYCIMLADRLGLDLKQELLRKIGENAKKYPADVCRGSSARYDEIKARKREEEI